jgi:hypothetical protein
VLAPFHETLYAHYHLSEHKRLDALTRDAEGLQMAKRNAMAFNKPKDLVDERNDLLDRMGLLPNPAEAMARALQTIEDLNTIDAARLEAEPHVIN